MTMAFQLDGQDFVALTVLGELLNTPDPEKSRRVMKALLDMKKIAMERLKRASG
jgi:hypothetical protein